MINEKIRKAFNEQIQNELYSAYIYLSMATYFHSIGLDGMGGWMRIQALEEQVHAMKLFDHVVERDGKVDLLEIKQPPLQWKSPLDAFKIAYEHEQFITGCINKLMKLADDENEYASKSLLQWFIDEQVEEEATASKTVSELEMIGDNPQALLMIDRELGTRTFTMPVKKEE